MYSLLAPSGGGDLSQRQEKLEVFEYAKCYGQPYEYRSTIGRANDWPVGVNINVFAQPRFPHYEGNLSWHSRRYSLLINSPGDIDWLESLNHSGSLELGYLHQLILGGSNIGQVFPERLSLIKGSNSCRMFRNLVLVSAVSPNSFVRCFIQLFNQSGSQDVCVLSFH